jgi:hypothetical protein
MAEKKSRVPLNGIEVAQCNELMSQLGSGRL